MAHINRTASCTPVLIIEVDVVDTQSGERRCDLLPHELGVASQTAGTRLEIGTEFGGEKDLAAFSCALEPDSE